MVITGASSDMGEATARELTHHTTDAEVAAGIRQYNADYSISPDTLARAVAYALSQPEDVDINGILFRPTRQEM